MSFRQDRLRAARWLSTLLGLVFVPSVGCSGPTPQTPADEALNAEAPAASTAGNALATSAPARLPATAETTPTVLNATQVTELAGRRAGVALAAIEERQQALTMRATDFEAETVAANRATQLAAILDDLDVTVRQAETVEEHLAQTDAATAAEYGPRLLAALEIATSVAGRLTAADGGQNQRLVTLANQLEALRQRAADAAPAP